ncbi:cytochrome c peroxidase [Paraburkholderia sp.]|uniref:cytochrome-c peroxidase n=1 Tax=Paraburkholderia sp. TaxID=1926495 RepID=UPI00239C31E6|nr:cytochrome c peroxidase [Paraburkholderia sp.]MDE1183830.1 cytochrome c peroxidase [Paraburkholderia sp.]
MSHPNTVLPPALPAGRQPNRTPGGRAGRTSLRRIVLRVVLGLVIACAALAGYALAYPERMPDAIGEAVENMTGANAHPVHFERPAVEPMSAIALLGKQLFNDPSLSASGQQSCASCHSASHAYGPPNDLSVQLGGPHMQDAGYRPPPSLTYLYRQAPFSIGPDAADADIPVSLDQAASAAQGVQRAVKTAGAAPAAPAMVPQGGLFWDGRADSLQRQALGPLTNPVEMANKDLGAVVQKLSQDKYRDTFGKLFGPAVLHDPNLLASEAMFAIARFQIEDPSFHAFSSKYDYWLEGRARLSQAELHGLRLFNDQNKANCAGCHLSAVSRDGLPPMFTDQQYEALGVPRNTSLALNKDPKFYDMGTCGPFRKDIADQTQYCGMFLTPTLRNTATRHAFFHNGVYHDLKHVMDFYNLRNTSPEKIYPRDASGKVQKYDDLPAKYQANIDVADAPFDRKAGEKPAMTDQDIDDIIAFLKTLNDGYKVN